MDYIKDGRYASIHLHTKPSTVANGRSSKSRRLGNLELRVPLRYSKRPYRVFIERSSNSLTVTDRSKIQRKRCPLGYENTGHGKRRKQSGRVLKFLDFVRREQRRIKEFRFERQSMRQPWDQFLRTSWDGQKEKKEKEKKKEQQVRLRRMSIVNVPFRLVAIDLSRVRDNLSERQLYGRLFES